MLGNEPEIIDSKFEDDTTSLCTNQTGAHDYQGISSVILKEINHRIAIGRMVISKYRYGKGRNIFEIYETECYLRQLK